MQPPKPSGPVTFIKRYGIDLATRHWQIALYVIFGLLILLLDVFRP